MNDAVNPKPEIRASRQGLVPRPLAGPRVSALGFRALLLVTCCLAAPHAIRTRAGDNPAGAPDWQMVLEQKHFFRCLAFVYDPAFWFSYKGSLYFTPKNDAQVQELAAIKTARSQYLALTNRQTRYELTAVALRRSGVAPQWQQKLLLPYSETNQNLTPTLGRPVFVLPQYEVIQLLSEGDALVAADGVTNFVMDFGRAANDTLRTNVVLVKEGSKTLTLPAGERLTLDAFTDAGLSKEEIAVLTKVAREFAAKAAALEPLTSTQQAQEDFENYLARAKDSSPYMEYKLARCYLEGHGTPKNQDLGLGWMKRAAQNGSGDARAYLEKSQLEKRSSE